MLTDDMAHMKLPVQKTLTIEQARFIAMVLGNMNGKQARALDDFDGSRLLAECFGLFYPHYPCAVQVETKEKP